MISNKDLSFVKSILPKHYTVKESANLGSVHCVSKIGISEDQPKKWDKVMRELKKHFDSRFKEVFHNVCADHTDFTVFLKP